MEKQYRFLGKPGSFEWSSNLEKILNRNTVELNFEKIYSLFKTVKSYTTYEYLKHPINSRFGTCFFIHMNKDVSVQEFDDEWYLININTNFSNHWYICDEIDGLKNCLKDNSL